MPLGPDSVSQSTKGPDRARLDFHLACLLQLEHQSPDSALLIESKAAVLNLCVVTPWEGPYLRYLHYGS